MPSSMQRSAPISFTSMARNWPWSGETCKIANKNMCGLLHTSIYIHFRTLYTPDLFTLEWNDQNVKVTKEHETKYSYNICLTFREIYFDSRIKYNYRNKLRGNSTYDYIRLCLLACLTPNAKVVAWMNKNSTCKNEKNTQFHKNKKFIQLTPRCP